VTPYQVLASCTIATLSVPNATSMETCPAASGWPSFPVPPKVPYQRLLDLR